MLKIHLRYVLLFVGKIAFGQEREPIDTDRPDQTETPVIVPSGIFQAETGFLHKKTDVHEHEYQLPETLFKIGLTDKLELRLITTLLHSKMPDSTITGLEPVIAGFKLHLYNGEGLLPETSVIVHLQLPKVAAKELQLTYLAPEIRLLFENGINNNIDIGYNAGISWDDETGNPEYAYTFAPDFKINDKLSAYVESFGYFPEKKHADYWTDGGFKYLITKDIQVDISAGYEVSSHNKHHQNYEAVGFSFRI
jgi:hypothetical protein